MLARKHHQKFHGIRTKGIRPRVGIPQALLYYHYVPLWKQFFEELGAEVVISEPTNKVTVDRGVNQTVDEACFPVKLYFGHILDLAEKVDFLFVPRLVSVEEKAYICPKFLGLPDMVRHGINGLPKLISPDVNLHKGGQQVYKSVWEVGKLFTYRPWKIYQAYRRAYQQYCKYQNLLLQGLLPADALAYLEVLNSPGSSVRDDRDNVSTELACTQELGVSPLTIAVISHPYNIYDEHASMGLLTKLREMGIRVLTPENVDSETVRQQSEKLPKRLFWTMGRKLVGSAFHYLEREDVDGIIHMAAFGCGPDSFTGELIEREIRRRGTKAYLNLTIDEHTGEAGIVTRLEAFLDMMQRRVAR